MLACLRFPKSCLILFFYLYRTKADAGLITEGQYIKGMSGMTCVCPAWQIMELLDVEVFAKERATDDQELLNREIENGPNAVGE